LLLVSHDRAFLDNVVTQTIAAEGGGRWREYVGGYSDWLRQRTQVFNVAATRPSSVAAPAEPVALRRKLSYKEQRELESLPGNIEKLEQEQHALNQRVCAQDYHRAGPEQMRRDRERAVELETLIHSSMERWEQLEALASKISEGRT